MTDNPFEQAQAFDRLEQLLSDGVAAGDPDAGDLAGELAVVHLLMQDAETPAMPRDAHFSAEVLGRLPQAPRHRRGKPWVGWFALAAAVVVGLLIFRGAERPRGGPDELVVDGAVVAHALDTLNRRDMVEYLSNTERLLMSIRDHEEACSENESDMGLERKLANELLLKQKRFTASLTDARYNQARGLFANLESILIDVKNLDPCTDPVDLELINDHISNKRILGKLRLIAQEIQMS